MFCELVTDFLQDHPTPSGDPIPDSVPLPLPAAQPAAILNHHNMSEEEQLKAAIAASLQEPIRICDDDEDEIETFSSDDEKDSDSPVELKQNHVNESESLDVDLKIKDTETSAPVVIEDHTDYLGTDTAETSLVLRLPDGNREVVTVPCDTKLKVSIPESLATMKLTHSSLFFAVCAAAGPVQRLQSESVRHNGFPSPATGPRNVTRCQSVRFKAPQRTTFHSAQTIVYSIRIFTNKPFYCTSVSISHSRRIVLSIRSGGAGLGLCLAPGSQTFLATESDIVNNACTAIHKQLPPGNQLILQVVQPRFSVSSFCDFALIEELCSVPLMRSFVIVLESGLSA